MPSFDSGKNTTINQLSQKNKINDTDRFIIEDPVTGTYNITYDQLKRKMIAEISESNDSGILQEVIDINMMDVTIKNNKYYLTYNGKTIGSGIAIPTAQLPDNINIVAEWKPFTSIK